MKFCNSKIIFLNGVGSVGKSSIARELQELLDEPFLHVGVDNFMYMFPEKFGVFGKHAHEGVEFIENVDSEGKPVININIGLYGKKLFKGMRHAIAALAQEGNNLIIDEVLLNPEDLDEYKKLLAECYVLFVGINAPLEVIEHRERERGDRMIGLARGQYEKVYKNKQYDIELDSSVTSARDSAQKIKEYVESGKEPQAFKKLG